MILKILVIIVVGLAWAWGSMAILIAGPESQAERFGMAAGFLAAIPVVLYLFKLSWKSFISLALVFAGLLVWWNMLVPTNNKDWAAEVANIPHGTIQGDILTLHNVRNFDYRSATDYSEKWETRTYDLSQIKSIDLYLSYWGSPHIAHTILSWGFANGDHLAVSIETRKDKNQKYSAIRGFFKQFTLAYIAADEKDVIRSRTNFRKEQVYLYRLTRISTSSMRKFLESYVSHMNRLVKTPEFYHALTRSCTSTIRLHTVASPDRLPTDWRLLANGHVDELLYEESGIRQDIPFEELRSQSRVDLAMQKLDAADFSLRIRQAAKIENRTDAVPETQ